MQWKTSEFVAEVQRYFAEANEIHGHGEDVEIVGTRTNDDVVDVVFRQSTSGPLIGNRYYLPLFASNFQPSPSARRLGEIAASEIAEPQGTHLEVARKGTVHESWAEGLVADPSSVYWREFGLMR